MNKIDKIVLDNGLNIYLYNDKRRHSTFFQFVNLCGGITKDFVVDGKISSLTYSDATTNVKKGKGLLGKIFK